MDDSPMAARADSTSTAPRENDRTTTLTSDGSGPVLGESGFSTAQKNTRFLIT
jgi:hypothetical protein